MTDALFTLLRAGLWGLRIEDQGPFPLSDKEWVRLFEEARKQTVIGIVYRGITLLPEVFMPPIPILTKWVAEVDRIERNNHKMNSALEALIQMYDKQGISPIVLKGQSVAAMYDTPEWRECGDIDLYIREEDRAKVLGILQDTGIEHEKHADNSICYKYQGIDVEHHTEMIDIETPSKKKRITAIIEEEGYSQDANTKTLAHNTNLLMLNSHIMKHAIGRGVGLRQLCDMARAYHTCHQTIDYKHLTKLYHDAGIEKWSILLHTFLVRHLGLPSDEQPYKNLEHIDTEPLYAIILQGGNFGLHHANTPKTTTAWGRKMQTLNAFWSNRKFAWKYARKEAFWTALNLCIGQFTK